MNRRILPCLTWRDGDVVKTTRFGDAAYVGDACNLVRIFSEKEVDELLFLDIGASAGNRGPDMQLVTDIAATCRVPLSYGGGISTIEEIRKVLYAGVEKVVIGTAARRQPDFLRRAVDTFGSSTITVCIDYSGTAFPAMAARGVLPPAAALEAALAAEASGAGEILLHDAWRDGSGGGYDLELLGEAATRLRIPVVALGGAADAGDIAALFRETGVSAAAAGRMMVFIGPHKAVLPSYVNSASITAPMPEWPG